LNKTRLCLPLVAYGPPSVANEEVSICVRHAVVSPVRSAVRLLKMAYAADARRAPRPVHAKKNNRMSSVDYTGA